MGNLILGAFCAVLFIFIAMGLPLLGALFYWLFVVCRVCFAPGAWSQGSAFHGVGRHLADPDAAFGVYADWCVDGALAGFGDDCLHHRRGGVVDSPVHISASGFFAELRHFVSFG